MLFGDGQLVPRRAARRRRGKGAAARSSSAQRPAQHVPAKPPAAAVSSLAASGSGTLPADTAATTIARRCEASARSVTGTDLRKCSAIARAISISQPVAITCREQAPRGPQQMNATTPVGACSAAPSSPCLRDVPWSGAPSVRLCVTPFPATLPMRRRACPAPRRACARRRAVQHHSGGRRQTQRARGLALTQGSGRVVRHNTSSDQPLIKISATSPCFPNAVTATKRPHSP